MADSVSDYPADSSTFYGVESRTNLQERLLDFEFSDIPKSDNGKYIIQRGRSFIVYDVSEGQITECRMESVDLLKAVQAHSKSSVSEESTFGSLKLRDIRQIVSPHGSDRPSIEARRNCILVNLLNFRCAILYGKAYVIESFSIPELRCNVSAAAVRDAFQMPCSVPQPKRIRYGESRLVKKLAQLSRGDSLKPFEFGALEEVLVSVVKQVNDEIDPLIEAADALLCNMASDLDAPLKLLQAKDLRRALDYVRERTAGVQNALKELLENEDQKRRMHITRLHNNPQEWRELQFVDAAEDLETLLECYEQEFESFLKIINRTDAALEEALQMVQLHLAATRNTFLKSELGIDILSLAVGLVGSISGIFGMNIKSGLEDKQSFFWILTFCLTALCGIAGLLAYIIFKKLRF